MREEQSNYVQKVTRAAALLALMVEGEIEPEDPWSIDEQMMLLDSLLARAEATRRAGTE